MATWLRIADARVQDDGAIPAEEEGIARGTGKKKERARALVRPVLHGSDIILKWMIEQQCRFFFTVRLVLACLVLVRRV